jgi:hypothetical protein
VAGTPELPADPTPEQLDAWLELAELVADEDFQRTTRANAAWAPRPSTAASTLTPGRGESAGR